MGLADKSALVLPDVGDTMGLVDKSTLVLPDVVDTMGLVQDHLSR